jgi:hypothetical protein
MAAVIAALVAYFCYQVASGMSETVTNGNITATVTAPPGSIVNNFTIRPENRSQSLELIDASSIWTIVNSTSGSSGTIAFFTSCHEVNVKIISCTMCGATFDRTLNGRDLKGTGFI